MQLLRNCCRHLSVAVCAVRAFVFTPEGAGRGSEDRTHAPVARPDSLANYSLHRLSIPRNIKMPCLHTGVEPVTD